MTQRSIAFVDSETKPGYWVQLKAKTAESLFVLARCEDLDLDRLVETAIRHWIEDQPIREIAMRIRAFRRPVS